MKTIHLDIVTPDGSAFSGEVESVVIPAWEGLLGILPGREPLMALLQAGELRYRQGGQEQFMEPPPASSVHERVVERKHKVHGLDLLMNSGVGL